MIFNPEQTIRVLSAENRADILAQMHNASLLAQLMRNEGLADCIMLQEPLARYTTFRIGGLAQLMLAPANETQLRRIVALCDSLHIGPYILGGGSKLLIVQEVLPIVLSMRRFKDLRIEGNTVYASAGTSLTHLIKSTVEYGLGGLEVLSGIPGTVGGALLGNAGSNWEKQRIDVGQFVEEVHVLDIHGERLTLPRREIAFSYRKSGLHHCIVCGAVFRFASAPVTALRERYNMALLQKLANQPLSQPSAGCVFKNPAGTPAWKLIQDAGLADARIGAAQVSSKHANFIVNLGNARGIEVMRLIESVKAQVKQTKGIDLCMEVRVW
jgi:UDP-N-acetylmuramate dehydrogenase